MGMDMGTGGMPTTGNIPETTEKLGCPTDIYPRQSKYCGGQPTIYPTTDVLKHLILSYSLKIKLNTRKSYSV